MIGLFGVAQYSSDHMANPVTDLDPRFSDPDATATDWSTTRSILESAQMSWVTTVRADGRPHVTPLVSVWLDDAAYFTTGEEEQKAVNLRNNPAVVLTTGSETWEAGFDVMVEGQAERVTDNDTLERLASAYAAKWDGRWQYEASEGGFQHHDGGFALVFRVTPQKVLTFGKGKFSHTRHRFV